MLDEYQDTNRLQDLIFRCISRNGENLFLVGDLKAEHLPLPKRRPGGVPRKKETFFPYDGARYPPLSPCPKTFEPGGGDERRQRRV